MARKTAPLEWSLINQQRELDAMARPAPVAPGTDRDGAPPIQELARAERAALLSFLPRAVPWADVLEFDERLADLHGRHAAAADRVRELAERVANEPQRHADAIARWALDGERDDRPESRLADLEAEHQVAEGERDGFILAIDRVCEERGRHVERNRDRLVRHADRLVNDRHGRLTEAIEVVERERPALAAARESALWARLYPGENTGRMPRLKTLAGGLRRVLQPLGLNTEVDASRVVGALREDADWLKDAVGPEQRAALGEEQPPDLSREAVWPRPKRAASVFGTTASGRSPTSAPTLAVTREAERSLRYGWASTSCSADDRARDHWPGAARGQPRLGRLRGGGCGHVAGTSPRR